MSIHEIKESYKGVFANRHRQCHGNSIFGRRILPRHLFIEETVLSHSQIAVRRQKERTYEKNKQNPDLNKQATLS